MSDGSKKPKIKLPVVPHWRRGKPNAPGLWIVVCNKEYVTAEIEWDEYDPSNSKDKRGKYLRITIDGDSCPLKEFMWECSPAFGPIPKVEYA